MSRIKYAIVTGASSGIGYCYACSLAQMGYGIIAVSNQAEELEMRAQQIRETFNTDVKAFMMDLSEQSAARELHERCSALDVEVLINNAGVYHDRDFLDDSEAFNSLILNLHVYTPAMLMYYFAADMAKRGGGYILNMSSVTSDLGAQRLAAYSATKGFLRLFSRATHIELKAKGVHVLCVRPGAIATPLYNIRPSLMRLGLTLGYITTPEKLAETALKALFKGKREITPGLYTKLLDLLIAIAPVCLIKLIRRVGLF